MALYIIYENDQWEEAHLPIKIRKEGIPGVKYIQVDGDELDEIRYRFSQGQQCTIPFPTGRREVRWYGDIAKTILGNLVKED